MARGGKREGAGRPKGAVNELTKTLREKAREHADDMLAALVSIAKTGESDAARVSAIKEILDRGYGKASTVLSGDEDGGPITVATRIELVGVRPSDNG